MPIAIILFALALLMTAAYRGASVILFAPVAALLAVAFTDPALILPMYSGLFLERMAGFIKLYFPLFLLGAVFGKLMEVSGFARAIIKGMLRFTGPRHAIAAVVLVCAVLTYGGVSLFVVAFAVYPFAAELFRASDIPKRLLPATIALGHSPSHDARASGIAPIQNIIPSGFSTPARGQRRSWYRGRCFADGGVAPGVAPSLRASLSMDTEPSRERTAVHPQTRPAGTSGCGLSRCWLESRTGGSPVLPVRYGDRYDFAGAGLAGNWRSIPGWRRSGR
jgi:hypothetical protein